MQIQYNLLFHTFRIQVSHQLSVEFRLCFMNNCMVRDRYEITLLSNTSFGSRSLFRFETATKLHYSQTCMKFHAQITPFETATKLHYSQTTQPGREDNGSLRPLRNYTTLKLGECLDCPCRRLRPLQNYTTLKLFVSWSPWRVV